MIVLLMLWTKFDFNGNTISEKTVLRKLVCLEDSVVPGPDKLPQIFLKSCTDVGTRPLQALFCYINLKVNVGCSTVVI